MTTHADAMDAPAARPTARSCPPTARRRCSFVRGEGTGLWDADGHALPRLPVRPRRHQPRPRPPRGGRRPRRAGPDAAARLEPVRHRARPRGGGHARPPAGRRRPGLLLQLRRRGQRVRHQAGPQVRAAAAATSWSAPTARSTAARWPRCTPPASRPSTRPSSRCPRASATSPGTTSTPSRRALDPSVAAVLLEPVQGEGGVNPADRRVLRRASAGSATSAACCSWSTRSRPASAARGAWFGFQHFGVAARRGHHGQGARQRRAHRRLLGQGRRGRGVRARRPRHDLRRPAPGHRRGPRGARRHGARGRARPGRARRARAWPTACSTLPRRRRRPGPRPAARRRARRATTPGRWPPAALDAGLVVNAVTPDRAAPRPAARSSPTTRSTRPSPSSAEVLADEAGHAAPPRDRRPRRRPSWPRSSTSPLDAGRPPAPGRPRAWRCCFEKPSARTRNSMEMAVVQLGGHPVTIRADEVGLDAREPAEDVARTLACYHAAIGARVFDHSVLERMAAASLGAGRQPAVRRRPPAARRWPTCSPCARRVRRPRRPHGRLRRRRQQRGPVAGPGAPRWPACRSASPARRATPCPRPTSTGSPPLGVAPELSRPPRRRRGRRRRRLHRRVDVDGPGGRGRRPGARPSRASRSTTALMAARRGRRRSSCTACPAHRGEEVTDDGGRRRRRAASGARPPTACTPPAGLLAWLLEQP